MISCSPGHWEALQAAQRRLMAANPAWSLARVLLRAKIEVAKLP